MTATAFSGNESARRWAAVEAGSNVKPNGEYAFASDGRCSSCLRNDQLSRRVKAHDGSLRKWTPHDSHVLLGKCVLWLSIFRLFVDDKLGSDL
jgi:hypothetical protein